MCNVSLIDGHIDEPNISEVDKQILETPFEEIIKKQKHKLYRLIVIGDKEYDVSYVSEFRWISENRFCVWVQFCWLEEFVDELKDIFGEQLFDDGGVNVNMQSDCVCIDMCELLNGYFDVKDILDIFPK